MPLYRIHDTEPVLGVPTWARKDYDRWTKRMDAQDLDAIMGEFDRLIELRMQTQDPDRQIHTAGWIPGSDWIGTVWEPIYEKAALQEPGDAAMCFGLLCFLAFSRRDENWYVGKFELHGKDIGSNTYFMPTR